MLLMAMQSFTSSKSGAHPTINGQRCLSSLLGKHRLLSFARQRLAVSAAWSECRVGKEAMILGEGEGFSIAQGRLGPGRLHHCMRAIGIGNAALEMASSRVKARRTFGTVLAESPLVQAQIAESWLQVHQAWCERLIALVVRLVFGVASAPLCETWLVGCVDGRTG
jgi:Acyl-CoA dehydrogenase, C-terminal domain